MPCQLSRSSADPKTAAQTNPLLRGPSKSEMSTFVETPSLPRPPLFQPLKPAVIFALTVADEGEAGKQAGLASARRPRLRPSLYLQMCCVARVPGGPGIQLPSGSRNRTVTTGRECSWRPGEHSALSFLNMEEATMARL